MAKPATRKVHESTRRTFVRLAFLMLSIVPLGLCLAWSLLHYFGLDHARQVATWEQRLSQRLGVRVSIEKVELLTPTQTRIHGLKIRDPENKVVYAQAKVVDHQWSRRLQRMKVYGLVVEGPRLASAYPLLTDLLIRPSNQDCELELQIASVEIRGGVIPQSFPSATLHVFPQTSETSLELDIVSRDHLNKQPIHLSLTRFHGEGNQGTELKFVSNETPLPCSLVRWFLPSVSSLGDQAELLGTATLDMDSAGCKLTIDPMQQPAQQLTINKVDFASASWNAPEIVTGRGWVRLDRVEVVKHGVLHASGELQIDNGEVQREFLQAASQQLGVQLQETLYTAASGMEGFGRVGLRFHLDMSSGPVVHLAGSMQGRLENGSVQEGFLIFDRNGIPLAAKFDWKTPVQLPNLIQTFRPSSFGLVEGVPSNGVTRGYTPIASLLENWLKPIEEVLHSRQSARASLPANR